MSQLLYILLALTAGFSTNFILPLVGVYHGKKAVDYYAEVHTTRQNIVVHVIGMPFTIVGMTLWIPALGELVYELDPYTSQYCLFAYYLGLYSYVKLDDCVYFCFMYYPTLVIGGHMYVGGLYDLGLGLLISTVALVFQEVVGHKWGGDPASRPEAVLNAIFYAKYFSAKSLKNMLRYKFW